MDPLRELGRILLILGAIVILAGALFYFAGRFSGSAKLPLRLGHLPGDIIHRGEYSTFYFPLATSLVISVALSLVLWLISHFRR